MAGRVGNTPNSYIANEYDVPVKRVTRDFLAGIRAANAAISDFRYSDDTPLKDQRAVHLLKETISRQTKKDEKSWSADFRFGVDTLIKRRLVDFLLRTAFDYMCRDKFGIPLYAVTPDFTRGQSNMSRTMDSLYTADRSAQSLRRLISHISGELKGSEEAASAKTDEPYSGHLSDWAQAAYSDARTNRGKESAEFWMGATAEVVRHYRLRRNSELEARLTGMRDLPFVIPEQIDKVVAEHFSGDRYGIPKKYRTPKFEAGIAAAKEAREAFARIKSGGTKTDVTDINASRAEILFLLEGERKFVYDALRNDAKNRRSPIDFWSGAAAEMVARAWDRKDARSVAAMSERLAVRTDGWLGESPMPAMQPRPH